MGADKGLQELCGKPLISYAIQALTGLCDKIIISSSSKAYEIFGFEVIADEFPGLGPMGGIYSALRQSKTEKNLVLSCDLPFVSADLLSFILNSANGFEVAVPYEGNRHYEPLCAFYHRSNLEKMAEYIRNGNYKLPDLFDEIKINKLIIDKNLDFYNKDLFLNVNSKHDLEAAEKLMRYSG